MRRLSNDCILASAKVLYADFTDKETILKQMKGLQLSDSTITRRIEDIGEDIAKKRITDISVVPCFSIAFDENTDVGDIGQLCV
jgi:hypothetical protein